MAEHDEAFDHAAPPPSDLPAVPPPPEPPPPPVAAEASADTPGGDEAALSALTPAARKEREIALLGASRCPTLRI